MDAPPPYPTLAFADGPEFDARLAAAFIEYGVVVVAGVFAPAECDAAMDEIVSAFERLSDGLDRREPATWTRANTPPQTRAGLYQAAVGNLATGWRFRADPRVRRLFTAVYSAVRGRPVTDFIVSGDGLNLQPRWQRAAAAEADWAHLDQTRGDAFRCAQGQAVLTDTAASLRASPRSHRAFADILAATGGPGAGDWRRFSAGAYPRLRALVEARGGAWQVPILAPKGSFILWASSVVHSARRAPAATPPDPADGWRGWRGVLYICYRPREEFSAAARRKRWRAFLENRVTNHWGTKLFPVNPCAQYGPPPAGLQFAAPAAAPPGGGGVAALAAGGNYVTSPAAVYHRLGRPRLGRAARRLAGHSSEDSGGEESAGSLGDDGPADSSSDEGAPDVGAPPALTDAEVSDLLGL